VPVLGLIWLLRISVLVLPILVAAVTYLVTLRLKRSDVRHLTELPATELVHVSHRTPRGKDPESEDVIADPTTSEGPSAEQTPPEAPDEDAPEPLAGRRCS
jgi:hypothetical protein